MKGTIVLLISIALAWIAARLTKHPRVVIQRVNKIADSEEVIGDYVQVPKSLAYEIQQGRSLRRGAKWVKLT